MHISPSVFRLVIVMLILLLSSCAGIMNQSVTRLDIISTEATTLSYSDGSKSSPFAQTRHRLIVKRSASDFEFDIQGEDSTHHISIPAQNSFAYWINLLYNLGIGMLVEQDNPSRYGYPRRVYVDMRDSLFQYSFYNTRQEAGQLFAHVSFPHINQFVLKPGGEPDTKSLFGYMGFSLGLDYHYHHKRFLGLRGSTVINFPVFVPAPVDFSGDFEFASSQSLILTDNVQVKRFSVGYGLAYARNVWDWRYYDRLGPPPPSRAPIKIQYQTLGLVANSYYQFGKSFKIGLIYRPTFLRFSAQNPLAYEHLISVDFAWRIRVSH